VSGRPLPPAVSVRDVCFSYDGGQEVLHNVSFDLPAHSFTVVLGPNGGGKTTLLKLLLGIETPDYGEVRVLGMPPAAARRRMGYVPQQLLFDPRFPVSVLDVALIGRIDRHRLGPYRAEDRAIALAALERVGIAGLANRAFAALSGGQRQRALIAQALVASPDILLLDEPTASVDSAGAAQLYALFQELSATQTVLMVSHSLNVVTRRATHLLCVNRTVAMRPLDDGYHRLRMTEGGMIIVEHDPDSHMIDATAAMRSPHHAAPPHGGSA
jgi:zinc transport system ATP-binding protein